MARQSSPASQRSPDRQGALASTTGRPRLTLPPLPHSTQPADPSISLSTACAPHQRAPTSPPSARVTPQAPRTRCLPLFGEGSGARPTAPFRRPLSPHPRTLRPTAHRRSLARVHTAAAAGRRCRLPSPSFTVFFLGARHTVALLLDAWADPNEPNAAGSVSLLHAVGEAAAGGAWCAELYEKGWCTEVGLAPGVLGVHGRMSPTHSESRTGVLHETKPGLAQTSPPSPPCQPQDAHFHFPNGGLGDFFAAKAVPILALHPKRSLPTHLSLPR